MNSRIPSASEKVASAKRVRFTATLSVRSSAWLGWTLVSPRAAVSSLIDSDGPIVRVSSDTARMRTRLNRISGPRPRLGFLLVSHYLCVGVSDLLKGQFSCVVGSQRESEDDGLEYRSKYPDCASGDCQYG